MLDSETIFEYHLYKEKFAFEYKVNLNNDAASKTFCLSFKGKSIYVCKSVVEIKAFYNTLIVLRDNMDIIK